jgi:zinc transport system substrate-binding protein
MGYVERARLGREKIGDGALQCRIGPSSRLSRILGVAATALLLCLHGQVRAEEPIRVTASILPLGDFVRQVGGERVRVTLLVPPGQNPHIFSLKPSQVADMQRVRLIVLNGLGLEFWADRVLAGLDNRGAVVLRLGEGLGFKPQTGAAGPAQGLKGAEETGEQHEHGPINPHVWLDPLLAMDMVRQIRDALAKLDPPHADEYGARTERYVAQLAALDAEYRKALKDLPRRTFIAYHAGYDHLAARYGLTQLAVLRGSGDTEPSPARVAEVIRTAKRLGVKAVFAEPQFPERAARLIAEEAGIGVARLDPTGQKESDTYLTVMRENLRQLAAALR